MFYKVFIILSVIYLSLADEDDLSFKVEKCKRADIKCITNRMREMARIMATTGFPEKGIEKANPLVVKDYDLKRPSFNLAFKNVTISGFDKAVITNLKGNFANNNCQYDTDFAAPIYSITGNYISSGQLSLFKFNGNGKFVLDLIDINYRIRTNCKFRIENNSEYMENLNMKLKMKAKKVHIYLENIIPGNAELSKTINEVLNENFMLIFNEEVDEVGKVFCDKLLEISNIILNNIPNLFLD